ncbi:mitochondrial import inner membrane translocase subunit Tim10-like [Tropilaelaps mercedesae]|uniref:Mitochondrial import inner membrane translocase subunit n=1 Tax=Tropilaelaps mercedesae TaxID=418985 RepID=A0A1V9XNZ5_9ACAR|nr:mitochondrial import inner membrane translocase subunit Tim10-like [Tropilaelaps mercedesae]
MATGMVLDSQQLEMMQRLEMEMMTDMYNRMTSACQKKCIPTRYREADLSKGEAVCIDRCVAKYLEIHERIGKRLTSISMQEEETLKKFQQPQ